MTDSGSARCRVLAIDDDPSCRTTMARLLQKHGYTVETVETGSAGLALLREKPVDVVLTDLMMPGLSGWDVARLVKAMHPRLPVVLVTGCAHTISSDQPGRQFVDAILTKPCGAAEMQAVIGPLTQGLADTACSGSPQRTGFTKLRERPTNASAPGTLQEVPVTLT